MIAYDAIASAFDRGILSVAAAGNDSTNACNSSPAREPSAITVGATERNDSRASYSNIGPCVDIFAPGSDIESADYRNNTGVAVLSGTSMAAPHVTGAIAKLLSEGVAPADVPIELSNRASHGVLTDTRNTVNKMLFSN